MDTLNIDFDVLSILCGVNDVGFERRLGIGNDIEKYEFVYDRMLYEAREVKSNAKIVLISPFLFKVRHNDHLSGYDIYNDWELRNGDIRAETAVVEKLAEKYEALFVDAYSYFEKLCTGSEPSEYSVDGIHLNAVGSEVLSKLWVDTLAQKGILK